MQCMLQFPSFVNDTLLKVRLWLCPRVKVTNILSSVDTEGLFIDEIIEPSASDQIIES